MCDEQFGEQFLGNIDIGPKAFFKGYTEGGELTYYKQRKRILPLFRQPLFCLSMIVLLYSLSPAEKKKQLFLIDQ